MSEALERVIAEQQKEIDRLRLMEKTTPSVGNTKTSRWSGWRSRHSAY